MFANLKSKNPKTSVFKNSPNYPEHFSRSPSGSVGSETPVMSNIDPNEGDRLVRCKICGFICDRDRDLSLPLGSWAGNGVKLDAAATAGTCASDALVPAAGTVTPKADTYYTRQIKSGCPCCGSLTYDDKKK